MEDRGAVPNVAPGSKAIRPSRVGGVAFNIRSLVRQPAMAVVLLGILLSGSVGMVLTRYGGQAEQELLGRFEARGEMGARFMSSYVRDIQERERRFAEERLGDSPTISEVRKGLSALDLELAVVLEDGRFVAGYPFDQELIGTDLAEDYQHLATATGGVPATSLVVPSAAEGVPVVAFATPYGPPRERRVISGGYSVSDSPIGAVYLDTIVPVAGGRSYLVDDAGAIVAASENTGAVPVDPLVEVAPGLSSALEGGSARGTFEVDGELLRFASHRVEGAPWRLITTVPEDALFGPLRGGTATTTWVLLVAAVLSIVATAWTLQGQSRRRKQLQASNTALMESSLQLEASRESFRVLVEQLPAVVYTAEPGSNGAWIYVSPRVTELFGIGAEEWMSSPTEWFDRIHPDDRAHVAAAEDLIKEAKDVLFVEYRLRLGDGSVRWVRDSATAVFDRSRDRLILQGTITDITQQRELEQQLMQSQKMEAVGQLAGGVAHDFNNLLAVVLNYANFVKDDLDEDDPRRDDINEIITAGQHGARLVSQLLSFSRKGIVAPQPLDVNKTVLEMQKMLHRLIGEDVTLRVSVADGLPPIEADAGQIEQIVANLVVNARDALPAGGEISMSTALLSSDGEATAEHPAVEPGDYVHLRVSDGGTGMSSEVVEHVFEPFFTTKGVGEGTGLGLATVYGVVQQAGGYVWIQSELGVGTVVNILLPASQERLAEEPEPQTKAVGSGRETVLVVEDESSVRRIVQRVLTAAGYRVIGAASGKEAITAYQAGHHTIDLVLTDVIMPGMSGKELAGELARIEPDFKLIYMSGYTNDLIAQRGVLPEGESFLQKPFGPDELLENVRSVLDGGPSAPTSVADASASKTRILIVEDEQDVALVLKMLLEANSFEVVGTASDGEKAIALATELRPDLVVLDDTMPVLRGSAASASIRRAAPATRIVGFSGQPRTEGPWCDVFLRKTDMQRLPEVLTELAAS